jgi:hypothetical protein
MIPINKMRGQVLSDSKDSIDKVVASHPPKLLSFKGLNLRTYAL